MHDFDLCRKAVAYAKWKREHPELADVEETGPDFSGVGDWVDAING